MSSNQTINTYDIGDNVRCSAAFTDANSTAFDPDVVRFKLKPQGQSITTYVYGTDSELVKDSTGNYHVDVDVTSLPGTWYYRFEGESSAGVGQGADEVWFQVEKSVF